jgi:hypothetical protein
MNRTLVFIAAVVMAGAFISAQGQTSEPNNGQDLVARLYKEHTGKSDPLQSPASKKLLQEYFYKPLLDLYLKDQQQSKGEVGKIDFDPLYDAQDIEVTDFNVVVLNNQKDSPSVAARFKNLGVEQEVVFTLKTTKAGWRIADIRYKDGRSLLKILRG